VCQGLGESVPQTGGSATGEGAMAQGGPSSGERKTAPEHALQAAADSA
jgi:hypothetical protein